jgi:hypothetical protein
MISDELLRPTERKTDQSEETPKELVGFAVININHS